MGPNWLGSNLMFNKFIRLFGYPSRWRPHFFPRPPPSPFLLLPMSPLYAGALKSARGQHSNCLGCQILARWWRIPAVESVIHEVDSRGTTIMETEEAQCSRYQFFFRLLKISDLSRGMPIQQLNFDAIRSKRQRRQHTSTNPGPTFCI